MCPYHDATHGTFWPASGNPGYPKLSFRRVAVDDGEGNVGLCWKQMRIDPKGTVAGWPALLVRRTLRRLRTRLHWTLGELESAASVTAVEGPALIKALLSERLIEAAGRDASKITQAGQTLSSASAAERVQRATPETALQQ